MSDRTVDAQGVIHEAVGLLARALMDRRVCIDSEEAQDIAEACLIDTWREFAGSTIYVRKTLENLIPARDRKLYTDYRQGLPIVELVRKYKLSDSYIYRVIKRIEKLGAPIQPELF